MKGTYDNNNYAFRIVYFRKPEDGGKGWSSYGDIESLYKNDKLIIGCLFQHEQQLYEYLQYNIPFETVDGLTVGELFKEQEEKEAEEIRKNMEHGHPNQKVIHIEGLMLLGYSIGKKDLEGREILAKILIDEKDLYASTIEYALASKMIKDYPTLNDSSKRKFLAFLERYVADYQQVREFAQTGKNILDGVDPLFGISAQGTARPMSK